MKPESWPSLLDRVVGITSILDCVLIALILLLVFKVPNLGRALASKVEGRTTSRLGTTARQMLAVGLLAIVARGIFLPWLGPAIPLVHDEHSLLLQAQTFLAGRLANPTPALWEHFETIHVNLVPTYASMYFPGRSFPLLLGLLLADNAWIGVWISFVAMCMAAVWMLRAWVAPPYALLGGILIVLRLGILSYWINSYWSGAFTAFGAMLVMGAAPRFLQSRSWRNSILLAAGASILLLTRPVEGALLCLPVAAYLLWGIWRSGGRERISMLIRAGVPAAILLTLSGAGMLSYNKATTGNALETPYDLNRKTYAITPAFLFSARPESEQRGPAFFREFYQWEDNYYAERNNPAKAARSAIGKIYYNWNFYVGLILTPAFLAGLWAARRRPFLLATSGFFCAAYLLETWNFPHYTAPIFPVLLIITMMGFEWLRHWRPGGSDTGIALTRAMPIGVLLGLIVPASNVITGWPTISQNRSSLLPCCSLLGTSVREQITPRLVAQPGRDIVLVSSEGHPPHEPVVYNEPDIAQADIIWAHSLGPESDAALLNQYPGRTVWQLHWRKDGSPLLLDDKSSRDCNRSNRQAQSAVPPPACD